MKLIHLGSMSPPRLTIPRPCWRLSLRTAIASAVLFTCAAVFAQNDDDVATFQQGPPPEEDQINTSLVGQGEANNSAVANVGPSFDYKVESQTGRFTYRIPIRVPPARQGAAPQLELAYSSAGANGWCGQGWSLDIGLIERDTRNGPPIRWSGSTSLKEYDDTKGFNFSMAGAGGRLIPTARTDEYRLEIQTTRLVFRLDRASNRWVVTDSGGNQFYFGQTNATRMTNARWTGTGTAQTFRWVLDRVIDINGNSTMIAWEGHGNLLYPKRIDYNGNINSAPITYPMSVVFELEQLRPIEQPDGRKDWSFRAGYFIEQAYRLKTIRTYVEDALVARYELEYHVSPLSNRSLLDKVTVYGNDNSTHLSPVSFTYTEPSLSYGDLTPWTRQATSPDMPYISANADANDTSYTLLDLNGDGLPDRVWREDQGGGQFAWKIEPNTGSSFAAATTFAQIDNSLLGLSSGEGASYSGFGAIADHVTYEMVLDMNGDGKPDRLVCNKNLNQQFVQTNTGTGLGPLTLWPNVWGIYLGLTTEKFTQDGATKPSDTDSQVMLIDMNGDGKPDRLYVESSVWKLQLNTGTGWASPVIWNNVSDSYITRVHRTAPDALKCVWANVVCTMIDINGDGLPDRITATGPNAWSVQYNRGDGFTDAMTLPTVDGAAGDDFAFQSLEGATSSLGGTPLGYNRYTVQGLFDRNTDALPDRACVDRQVDKFFYNKGVLFANEAHPVGHKAFLWFYDSNVRSLVQAADSLEWTRPTQGQAWLRDINGDGLPDRIVVMKTSSTSGWLYPDSPGCTYPPANENDPCFLAAPVKANSKTLYAQLSQGGAPDLLKTVTSPLGGKVTVTYVPSSTFPSAPPMPFPVQVVKTITTDDGFGNLATTTYNYIHGYYDGPTREFRGFFNVEEVHPNGTITRTYFHQGGGYDGSAEGEYQDTYAKKGLPFKVNVLDANRTIVHRVLNKIEVARPEGVNVTIYFPYVSQTITMDYVNGSSYRAIAEQLTYDQLTGNVRVSSKLGEIRNVDLSYQTPFVDVDPADNVRTETTYHVFANTDIVNKPDVVTVSKQDLSEPHKTRFHYDDNGNVTSTDKWLAEENRWISQGSAEYDSLGNPFRTTDAAGVVTETTYEADYSTFPVTTTIAPGTSLAMTSKKLFDVRSGDLLRATNHLGVIVQTDYDALFRPTQTLVNETPFAEPTLWRTRTDYYLNGISGTISNNKIYHRIYDANDTINGIESYTYLDGLGRAIQTRAESETNTVFRCADTFYDDTTRDAFVPNPYFGTGSAYSPRTSQQLGTYSEADLAGRPWRVTPAATATYDTHRKRQGTVQLTGGDGTDSPVAGATTVYNEGNDPWVTIATDPRNNITKMYKNGFGRITKVVNAIPTTGDITTRYDYDLVGNLKVITDNNNNRTEVGYDRLGRKTSQNDPDVGLWTYQYDDANRLLNQYDAKGQRVHLVYESTLGRLQTKEIYDASGGLRRHVDYRYDISLNGDCTVFLGQLSAVTDTSALCNCIGNQRFWSYDYKGRVLKEGIYAPTFGTFVTSSTYNTADQIADLYYPNDVARVRHTYQNGVLAKVQSLKGTGPSSEVFYELTSINEFGQAAEYLTHNGQVTNATKFYPNSRRLKTLSVSKGNTDILKKTYAFDASSNLKAITDNVAIHTGLGSGTMQDMAYDELNRLTGLTDASASRSYAYDKLGNLTFNGDSAGGNYSYSSSRPHAVTTANGKTYIYDLNGNMTNRDGQTLIYDEENRLTQVTNSTYNVHFGYDYQGARLWKFNKNSNLYTCFISPLYEYRESDTAGLCYVFASGHRIAAFRPTSDVYTVADNPHSWGDRFKASTARLGDQANAALCWFLAPNRVHASTSCGALLFILALFAIARGFNNDGSLTKSPHLFFSPLRCRLVSIIVLPALLIATMPVRAAFLPGEVFYYFHADHLGSSNVITDRSGNVVQQYEYKAYGAERYVLNNASGNPEDNLTYRFTGQAFDDDTGLAFYNARYYDPQLGRFTQPDRLVSNPEDSQLLNRYSYCGNNPLKYADPSGEVFFLIPILVIAAVGAIIGGIGSVASGGSFGAGALSGALTAVGGFLGGPVGAALGGALGGMANAAIAGGDISQIATAGFVAGLSAGIGFAVGTAVSTYTSNVVAQLVASVATGGAIGGLASVAMGGTFLEGAWSGAVGAAAGFGAAKAFGLACQAVQKAAERAQAQRQRALTSNELGPLGERLAGVDPDEAKTRIPSSTQTAEYREPDKLRLGIAPGSGYVQEVKYVNELVISGRVREQLTDIGDYARVHNIEFFLRVRTTTIIRYPGTLQFIQQYNIRIIADLPPPMSPEAQTVIPLIRLPTE